MQYQDVYKFMDMKNDNLVRVEQFVEGVTTINWRPMPPTADLHKVTDWILWKL